MPEKIRTSFYLNRGVWEAFREAARRRGIEESRLQEEVLREEAAGIEEFLRDLAGGVHYGPDFQPVEPLAPVSPLVREMRGARDGELPG